MNRKNTETKECNWATILDASLAAKSNRLAQRSTSRLLHLSKESDNQGWLVLEVEIQAHKSLVQVHEDILIVQVNDYLAGVAKVCRIPRRLHELTQSPLKG